MGPNEATPHNGVHDWIGGDMGNFYSPTDPIFWLSKVGLLCWSGRMPPRGRPGGGSMGGFSRGEGRRGPCDPACFTPGPRTADRRGRKEIARAMRKSPKESAGAALWLTPRRRFIIMAIVLACCMALIAIVFLHKWT